MAIEFDDMLPLLVGQTAVVVKCEATNHGDNPGCLCELKGKQVTIGAQYVSVFAGTHTWWISETKRALLPELVLVPNKQ